MEIIKLKNVNKLEIFNTHYKIKLKGIVVSRSAIKTFILNIHDKLYAITSDVDKIKFYDDIDTPEKFKETFFEDGILYLDYNNEIIVEESEEFKSNVFSIKQVLRRYYDKRTLTTTTMLTKQLVLNSDIQDEIDDNRSKYEIDKNTFIKKLYNIKETNSESRILDEEACEYLLSIIESTNKTIDAYKEGVPESQIEIIKDIYGDLLKLKKAMKGIKHV